MKSRGFGNNQVRKLIYIIIIIGSVSICFLGIKSNSEHQNQRKIEHAKSTIKNEAVKINQLNKQIIQLYQDGLEEFLVEPVEDEKLQNIEREILTLKTEASDFGLEHKDFSIDNSEVVQGKKDLVTKISNVKNKRAIQKQITALVLQAPSDWTANPSELVINETASTEKVAQIRNEASKAKGDWSNAIIALLAEIDSQIKQYTDLKQALAEMSQDGVLTDSATVEKVNLIFNQLDQIKNEPLKKELADQVEAINALLDKQALGEEVTAQEEVPPSE